MLLFGGTRFFGRRLAVQLMEKGHRLTIVTRGQAEDGLGPEVERIRADRADHAALDDVLRGRQFDLVYDQICYTPREAKAALDALGDRVRRYVFTSSMSVYGPQEAMIGEEAFAPESHRYDLQAEQYTYAEGKRQAEAYFFRHAPCPVVAARVSMVISGTDDYTGRFDFHVANVAKDEPIGVDQEEQDITFVTAWDAADFLFLLGSSPYAGPINVGNGCMSAQAISRSIGAALGKEPRFVVTDSDDPRRSPYVIGGTLRCSLSRAREIGYSFPPLAPQLPKMTLESAMRLGLR
ncbi:MAG: NAD-dependent epimerase/dehydratase family protein [Thermaerobacter sp.]|nr:NAD-dependent epimerase/dehydratase family protein [Thermaerobacter sp.]